MLPRKSKESGIVLIVSLLMLLIFVLLLRGFYSMVIGAQQVAASARDNVVTFYGAEGGLEQLSAGLADLFASTASPSTAQINTLSTPTYTPAGITYPTFTIGCPNAPCTGLIPSTSGVIGGSSALAGLSGVLTPLTLTVVADGPNHTEVKLVRQVQIVAIPIFEFGIFSETDLSFFAGPNFNFGGRVHTNGYLFLAEGDGNTLTLSDKVTVYKDIIRTQLANGYATSSNYTGTVNVIVTAGGCPGTTSTCRSLAPTEGSVTGGPGSAVNSAWYGLSLSTYNGNIRTGATGAKKLNLKLALAGAQPIDLIRRSLPNDTAITTEERLMNQASLRILLSDTAAALPGNGTNDPNGYPAVIPLNTTLNTSLPTAPAGTGGTGAASGIYGYVVDACHPPMALSPGGALSASPSNTAYWDTDFKTPINTPLLGGFIEIDIQSASNPGTWIPVTMEILQQGIERPHTNTAPYTLTGTPQTGTCTTGSPAHTFYPIVHLEQVIPSPTSGTANFWDLNRSGYSTTTVPATRAPGSTNPWDYMPLNMYDTREGNKRDTNDSNIYLNGVMNYVELDVANLQRWFACNGIYTKTGSCSGTLALGPGPGQANEIGGYIVYFSDRRGNYKAGADNLTAHPPVFRNETGEYGNEDIINAASAAGAPDGFLEYVNYNNVSPEDVNGNGTLDTYGATPDPYIVSPPPPAGACIYAPGCAISPFTTVTAGVAAKNSVVFFRRALRLYHGALGQLPPLNAANCTFTPISADGYGGFTVAAENPVYIFGDYNADTSLVGTGIFSNAASRCHVPAAVLADAVTVLSSNWNDANSFTSPTIPANRAAVTTSYRTAVMAGKNIAFAQPTGTPQDFGTDGGIHNFLRYLENWNGSTFNYRGSLVSFYYAVQATGVYKCCTTVYNPPTRVENFDTDFQSIQTLPPGTPRFTDVNALSFEQALLPSQ